MSEVKVEQVDRLAAVDASIVDTEVDWVSALAVEFAKHRIEATRALSAEVEKGLNNLRDQMEKAARQDDLTTDQLANIWGCITGVDAALSLLNKEPAR